MFVGAYTTVHIGQMTACRSQFSTTMFQGLNSGHMSASGLLHVCTCTCMYMNTHTC